VRVLFALPGLHRVNRGAEVAFESVAHHLAASGEDVVVIGSGRERAGEPYTFRHAPAANRERFERWPKVPFLRSDYMYEELTFAPGLLRSYRGRDFDVTLTCGFPYTHWVLRGKRRRGRPAHVYVTQNGDWPAFRHRSEYRFFSCDGLVCINPVYERHHRERWRTALIPNGVDPDRFFPGASERARFGIPAAAPVVLMVSALIPSKRVVEGVRAVAAIPDAVLIVAGDGAQRQELDALAEQLMPGRFIRRSVPRDDMPALYRSADVFLHLTLDEPFGNVYAEAMASGLGVVAHDTEVTRWICGEQETLVDTTGSRRVTEALVDALARTGEDVAERVDRTRRLFSWGAVATQYRTFLTDVVEGRVERS
jgi:glycosyltransferase involved in cell wall biosynthesis